MGNKDVSLDGSIEYCLRNNRFTDPPRKEQPPNKGHYSGPLSSYFIFNLREEDSREDKMADPKVSVIRRFHCG